MYIKGTFFTARRQAVIREFGEARWAEVEAAVRERSPTFKRLITPASKVEYDDYVVFQETLLDKLYGGDERAYWTMGSASAAWALTEGPYTQLLSSAERGVDAVKTALPLLWRVYSDEGSLKVDFANDVFTVEVAGASRWHPSIEYSSMGYGEKTIELALHRAVRSKRVYGAAEGRMGCSYRFELGARL